jgi:hypothetical protein
MRFEKVLKTAMGSVLLLAAAGALAHPGHVHQPDSIVHGYSWVDVVALLLASAALPAVAWLGAWLKGRRSRRQ